MEKIKINKIYIKEDMLKVVLTTEKNQNMYDFEHDVSKLIASIYEIEEYNLNEYWTSFNNVGCEYKAGETITLEWYTEELCGITKVKKRDFEEEARQKLAYQKRKKIEEEKRKREMELDSILKQIKQKILEKESNDEVFENFKKISGSFDSFKDLTNYLKN